VDILAQQKLGGSVKSPAIEQVLDIHRGPGRGQLGQQRIGARVEDGQVAQAVLDEHGPDHGPAVVPCLPVDGEDAVAEERAPELVPLRAVAKVGKLGGQDGLDLLGVAGDEDALGAREAELGKMGCAVWGCGVEGFAAPVREPVVVLVLADLPVEANSCSICQWVGL
jgi:hypothetical protein